MTKALKDTLRDAETWSEADQEELMAHASEISRRHSSVYQLSAAEMEGMRVGMAQADRREFASDEDVARADREAGV